MNFPLHSIAGDAGAGFVLPRGSFTCQGKVYEKLATLEDAQAREASSQTSLDPKVHKKSFVKSHILGYDGVWYSSFWSEGSRNNIN